VSYLEWLVRTGGNLIFIPLRGEDTTTLRVKVLPVGRAAPFESTAPAVVVYCPVAHEVGTTVALLRSWVNGSHRLGSKRVRTKIVPVMFTEGSRKHPKNGLSIFFVALRR